MAKEVEQQDVKYGRIFTEADMLQMLANVVGNIPENVRKDLVNSFEGTFPKVEPTFVLRAKDKRAAGAIKHYLEHQSPRAPQGHLDTVEKALSNFTTFRIQHHQVMKEPD